MADTSSKVPFCFLGSEDCANIFTDLNNKMDKNTTEVSKLVTAILGDEYSVNGGILEQIKRQERRIKTLERVYTIAAGVVIVGGVLLGILSKLGISINL